MGYQKALLMARQKAVHWARLKVEGMADLLGFQMALLMAHQKADRLAR